jgi:hypothetical protein
LTAPRPIKPTSPRCHSAWQPNPGRGSTYRCGKSVQTTGTTSQGIGPFAYDALKCGIDLTVGVGMEGLDLQVESASDRFHVLQCRLGIRLIGPAHEHAHASGCRHQLAQKPQPFGRQLNAGKVDAG